MRVEINIFIIHGIIEGTIQTWFCQADHAEQVIRHVKRAQIALPSTYNWLRIKLAQIKQKLKTN